MENVGQNKLTSPEFKNKLASLYAYLHKKLELQQIPSVKVVSDAANAAKPFGYTAHYDPSNNSITLFNTNRHDTDVLRSFAHEVIHHWQNEHGTLSSDNGTTNSYAQKDENLRKREMEAYLFGNMIFRDWQDEQRYGKPEVEPELPQPINENFELDGGIVLKSKVDQFINDLVSDGVITSTNPELSSGVTNIEDFKNDLRMKLLTSIQKWVRVVNSRSNY